MLVLTSLYADSPPTVLYPSGGIRPGQTLIVELPNRLRKTPLLHWGDRQVPFYKAINKNWRALIRVPLELDPGEAEVEVEEFIGRSSKSIRIPFKMEILNANFGFETILFPEEKAKLLNDPSEDAESKLIRVFLAKAEDTSKQYWRGKFIKPISGRMTSPYGIKRKKVGQKKLDFHRGIDLLGSLGEEIKAPNNARVLMVRDFKFHGKTVLLDHGQGVGSITIHMEKIDVEEGQKVKKGERIGTVGMSGLATAPHLHWGIYVHGKAVDPIQWLEQKF